MDRLCEQKVLVPVDCHTEWCSPIVVVPKANKDEIRLCGDYTRLNNGVKRAVHPIPKIEVSLARLKGAKIFSRLDANSGYHQVELEKESQHLTTLMTPFGRYMYTRLPFGIKSASDDFLKMFANLFADLGNVLVHVDDILIFAGSTEEHTNTLETVLERLRVEGVTLNRRKCAFGVREVEFLGHCITEQGIGISPKRVSAIAGASPPNDKNSLLRFLGTVNFVGRYIPNKSKVLEPLNSLLKNNVQFVWLEPQKRAYEEVIKCIINAPILAHFDYSKKIIIQADASSYGLGGALMQANPDEEREVVAYASRTLSAAEQRYSQIEKEASALAFATERFKDFISGIVVTLETDHKPLLQILGSKLLDELTPRLQRIRLRLMRYSYEVVYVPGRELVLADYLSRNPLKKSEENADELPNEIDLYVNFVVCNMPASNSMLDRIRMEQDTDPICMSLKEFVAKVWPEKGSLHKNLIRESSRERELA